MIIISHRGGAGLGRENTLGAIKASYNSGADIIHVDVRLTQDGVPVLLHDAVLTRTHKLQTSISSLTYDALKTATKQHCPPKLETVLDNYFGKVLLNIELRARGSGKVVTELVRARAGTVQSKWDSVLLSSFKVSELFAARRATKEANIGLLQGNNPFAYIAYHRFLHFTAVGFHRLHANKLALEIAKKAQLFTYAYTVDRPQAATHLAEFGFDGVMTDYPDKLSTWLSSKSRKKSKR